MTFKKYFVSNLKEVSQNNTINGSKMGSSKLDLPTDEIVQSIGSIGKWQILIIALIFLAKFPVAFHQMSIIFLAPPVKYHCDMSTITNSTNNEIEMPVKMFNMECSKSCKKHVYDRSIFEETIVTEWDLVCDREWLKDITQTIFMFGILVGNLVFGHLADSFGRRRPLLVAIVLQLVSGSAAAFAMDWYTFTAIRFFLAAATGGTLVISFVMIMEIIGTQYRDIVGILFQIPFNFGHLFLSVIAYYLRDWHMFQLAISLPSIALLSYYWFMVESPRWLVTSGQTEKAVEILEKIAKCNNLPTNNIKENVHNMSYKMTTSGNNAGSFLDLFRAGIWVKTLCISFNWLVCGLCLFGVSHYVGQTSGDIFINVAISASVQIPGTIAAVFMNRSLGRKITLVIGNCLTGASCLLIAALTSEAPLVRVLLAALGILGVSISFPTVYLYAGEVFPTIVRNSGVGFCSMSSRIGAMSAPFIVGLTKLQLWLPALLFGVVPLIGAALCVFLPETKGKNLTNTLKQSHDDNVQESNVV